MPVGFYCVIFSKLNLSICERSTQILVILVLLSSIIHIDVNKNTLIISL